MASFPKIRFVIKLQDWQIAIVAQFSLWCVAAVLKKDSTEMLADRYDQNNRIPFCLYRIE